MSGPSYLPPQASDVAAVLDSALTTTLFVAVLLGVALIGLLFVMVLGYRARPGREEPKADRPVPLVVRVAWVAVPGAIVAALFVVGLEAYLPAAIASTEPYRVAVALKAWEPEEAEEGASADVVAEPAAMAEMPSPEEADALAEEPAEQAGADEDEHAGDALHADEAADSVPGFAFTYPNGYVGRELRLPAGRRIELVVVGGDTGQRLSIPAFRVAAGALPRRETSLFFETAAEGRFPMRLASVAGAEFAGLAEEIVVQDPPAFEEWLREASDILGKLPPVEAGAMVYQIQGCNQCHSVNGTKLIGPTFQGIWGREEVMVGGQRIVADASYIRESILEPLALQVEGYDPVMPSYQGRITDEEIDYLIEYFKSISVEAGP